MTREFFCQLLFWLSLAALAYTFIGYPLLIFLLGRCFPKKQVANISPVFPTVTVVLAAYNEEQRIVARLKNLFAAEFPKDKLTVVVVSDCSTDSTAEKIESYGDSRIHLIRQSQRSGKAQCLNIATNAATGALIVFADTRQRFATDTIAKLAQHFHDPRVGAVSGALMIESAASSVGGGVDAYWRFEKFIRFSESLFDSSIGCTGAVYGIRRNLFQNIPPDTLLDDVVIPMQVALQNQRVLFDPTAMAFDPQSLEPAREKIRKQRTLAGNFQILFRYPGWLLPWRNRLWWQLLSHKYLRLAAPIFLLTLFFSNALLLEMFWYRILFVGQCGFYFLALVGSAFSSVKNAAFSIPAGFVFLNRMALSGGWHYWRGSYEQGKWPTTKQGNL